MITSLRLQDFKNFRDETLCVGSFTVIVGANASGKSNIRDAFRFLHGIGKGYTLAEIIDGVGSWSGLRGAVNEIARLGQSEFALHVRMKQSHGVQWPGADINVGYSIRIRRDEKSAFRVMEEKLEVESETAKPIYEIKPGDEESWFKRNQPVLPQFLHRELNGEASRDTGDWLIARQTYEELSQICFLNPLPDLMRKEGFPGKDYLGENGENLPMVLRKVCVDQKREAILSEWIRELTPMDVKALAFRQNELDGRVQLVIREGNDREMSAYSASDGTLRFLAILVALLDSDMAPFYVIEELETGIHPSRLHLLVDLIENQTAKRGVQVITTTYSPNLLSIVGDETFEDTSIVFRLEDTDDAVIRPVIDLPNVRDLRKSQGLGRLLTGNWMETTLAFAGDSEKVAG